MNITAVVQITGVVLAVVVGVASVVAYLRTNIARATIALYKTDNDALRTRLTTTEDDVRKLSQENIALLAKVSVLEGVVTQREAMTRVETALRYLLKKEGFDYDRGQ